MPDDQLPVLLPDDVDFQPGGESPLARHPTWKHVACPSCGGRRRRATPTRWTRSSTRAGTSSGTARRATTDGPFRREDVDRWMPANQYTGGVEHAILHLLYCRFFTKVLYDMDLVGFTEPFPRLMNQGQVIYDGASMSKSKGNIVEPMPLVERWGADTMRLIDAVRRAVRGRHRLEADRGRSRPPAGRAPVAGPRVRGGGRRRRRRGARSRRRSSASRTRRSRV